MNAYRYIADSPADAFAVAAEDSDKWDLPTMEALTEMATRFREGYRPTKSALGYDCHCTRGYFRLYDDDQHRGYSIALVLLYEHEISVDDPAA